ncbi:MAG: ParB/RepB/Spo0J family partition protein [Gammaproteobacteria bacterium]|jgi:ParB-like chromosome segregation protein Spo0J|nr:ParB/RepB/Spo0J family partition protein [Gammaproteobacteria bacterium]
MAKKPAVTTREYIAVDKLWIDSSMQPRVAIDMEVVSEYAEAMVAGAEFTPVVAFLDGGRYYLADGFHRVLAAREAKVEKIAMDLHDGTIRDAVLYSVQANAEHGLRRTSADKRRAVERLLRDAVWAKWSDSEIAKRCRVSRSFAQNVRSSLATVASEAEPFTGNGDGENSDQPATQARQTRTYISKHGTAAEMRTERIGRTKRTPGAGAGRPARGTRSGEIRRVQDPDCMDEPPVSAATGSPDHNQSTTMQLPTRGADLAEFLAARYDREVLDAMVTRLLQLFGVADD